MNVTFTLTAGSALTAAGPFNISGTTSSNVVSELATGITKDQLLTGHTINSVNDAITGGTIASTGTCTTTDTWSVNNDPIVYTYDCIDGSCFEVEGTGGTYGTLQLCQGSCSGGGSGRYDCTLSGCVEAVDGDFATYQDCVSSGCAQP